MANVDVTIAQTKWQWWRPVDMEVDADLIEPGELPDG